MSLNPLGDEDFVRVRREAGWVLIGEKVSPSSPATDEVGQVFLLFGRRRRVAESLANQTIGGQSVMFRLFREIFEAEASSIRRLELTYFAAATVHYAFIAWSRSGNKERIVREFIQIVVDKSLPHAGEKLSGNQILSEYEIRRSEYFRLIDMVIGRQPSSSRLALAAFPEEGATVMVVQAFCSRYLALSFCRCDSS